MWRSMLTVMLVICMMLYLVAELFFNETAKFWVELISLIMMLPCAIFIVKDIDAKAIKKTEHEMH